MGSKQPVLSFKNASECPGGRKKVALKPRRSLMDWIRFTQSGKDLTSTGGKCMEVTLKELSKHNSRTDAWISVKGKVYNVTHYMEYHPGGEEELLRGAGQDATELFNEVHQWVNVDSMLQKCFIGFLKKSWGSEARTKKVEPKKLKAPSVTLDRLSISQGPPLKPPENQAPCSKSKWPVSPSGETDSAVSLRSAEDNSAVTLTFESSTVPHRAFLIDLVDRTLFAKFDNTPQDSLVFSIDLQQDVQEDYGVNAPAANALQVRLPKVPGLPQRHSPVTWALCSPPLQDWYWSCRLVGKRSVTSNTKLFTLLLPLGTRMHVPIGGHINVKLNVGGKEVCRRYTPVVPLPGTSPERATAEEWHHILLLVKIYAAGLLTPAIDRLPLGAYVPMSQYTVTMSEDLLLNSSSVLMLAAGTGITPMINIIHWIINAKDEERPIHLYFFNKTEEDIIWRKELDQCCQTYNKFEVVHILSEAAGEWSGLSGKMDEELVKKILSGKPDHRQQIFICGPLSFNEATLRSLQAVGYNMDYVYAFSG